MDIHPIFIEAIAVQQHPNATIEHDVVQSLLLKSLTLFKMHPAGTLSILDVIEGSRRDARVINDGRSVH